jgi:hypothetical protein
MKSFVASGVGQMSGWQLTINDVTTHRVLISIWMQECCTMGIDTVSWKRPKLVSDFLRSRWVKGYLSRKLVNPVMKQRHNKIHGPIAHTP